MFRIQRSFVNFSDAPKLPENHEAQTPPEPAENTVNSPAAEPVFENDARPAEREASADRDREEFEKAYREALESGQYAAEEIKSRAEEDARLVLQEAQAEAQGLREQAWSAGYEDGMKHAAAELERQRSESAEAIRGILTRLESEQARVLDSLEDEIVDLCLAMTKKIVNFAAETDDKIFESMITKALKQIKAKGKITIEVSSAEYEKYFSSESAAFVLSGDMTATVVENPALGSWDCVVDTENGAFDAGLDTQIRYIRIAFDGVKGNEADKP